MGVNFTRSIKAPFLALDNKKLFFIYLTLFIIIIVKYILVGACSIAIYSVSEALTMSATPDPNFIQYINLAVQAIKAVNIIGFLVLTAFQIGYILETVKLEIFRRKFLLVSWDGNFRRFFLKGLTFTIITAIYISPIIIIKYLINFFSSNNYEVFEVNSYTYAISTIPLPTIEILAVWLLYSTLIPIIMCIYAYRSNFLDAFDVTEIYHQIRHYFAYYLSVFTYSMFYQVGLVIMATCLTVTCLGILFIPILIEFIFPVMLINLYAQVYRTSLKNENKL